MTVTLFTGVFLGDGSGLPWPLVVTGATVVTALSTGVVFTHTLQLLGNLVQRAALGVAITDTHPPHRDVFDGVIIPPGDDGVDLSGVAGAQRHQVGVERSDSLKLQSDETSRREVQEFRGQIIGSGSAVNQ